MFWSTPTFAAENKTLTFRELPLKQQLQIVEYKEAQERIIVAIMECESKGNPNAINRDDAKITGYPSIGLYQFQWKTWQVFAEKYKVLENATKLTYKQTLKYLYNPVYNAAVAHGMIKNGFWTHWRNCGKQFGLENLPQFVFRY